MNRREYYKPMGTVFLYYSILFACSSLLSLVAIHLYPASWMSLVAFVASGLWIHRSKTDNIQSSIAITSSFVSSFAWMLTYILSFEIVQYSLPLIYIFSAFILLLVSVLASHYKLRFSCVSSYAIAGICTFVVFPPILMMTNHNLFQSIAVIIATFYETALLITHSNYLIVYKRYTDPYQVFLKVNGK